MELKQGAGKAQEPLLVRANVTENLRQLRKEIQELQEKPGDHKTAGRIQELQKLHEEYRRRFINLVHSI